METQTIDIRWRRVPILLVRTHVKVLMALIMMVSTHKNKICDVWAALANCIDDKCCPPGSDSTGIRCSKSDMMIPISKSLN